MPSHPLTPSPHNPITILGIDPGLQRTGWGIIKAQQNQLSFIACGVITSDAELPLATRLNQLHKGVAAVIAKYAPAEAAVEETFVNVSGSSTLKLGQARGALLLSLSLAGLPVSEYSANLVKKSVVGSGHADKKQVGMMVKVLLPASNATSLNKGGADAADALAVAITHSHHRAMHMVMGHESRVVRKQTYDS